MATMKINLLKKALSVAIGILFGIGAFWTAISLLDTRNDVKESDIKDTGIRSLQKGAEDRRTWDEVEDKPKKISPSDTKKSEFRLSNINKSTKIKETTPWRSNNPIETLMTGTQQEYFYNTGEWIPLIEEAISEFVKDPNWISKHTREDEKEKDPLNTKAIAEIALSIKSLESKLDKALVKSAQEKIIREVITPYIENFKEKSQSLGADKRKPISISNTTFIASILIEDKKLLSEILNMSKDLISLYLEEQESFEMNPSNQFDWEEEIKHLVLLSETFLATTSRKVNLYEDKNIQKVLMLPLIWGQSPQSQLISGILESRFKEIHTKTNNESQNIEIPKENRLLQVWTNHKELKTKLAELDLNGLRSEIEKTAQFPPKSDKNNKYTFIINEKLEGGKGYLGSFRLFENSWPKGIHITGDAGLKAESSLGQPLPTLDGQLQRLEEIDPSNSKIIRDDDEQLLIAINLLPAYNIEGLKKANRLILWDKVDGALHVKDSIAADRPLKLSTPIITEMDKTPITVIKGSSELSATASVTKNKQGEGFRATVIDLKDAITEGYIEYSIYPNQKSKIKYRDITISDILEERHKMSTQITEYWMESHLTRGNGENIPLWVRIVELNKNRGGGSRKFFFDIFIGDKDYLLLTTDTEYAENITLLNQKIESKEDSREVKETQMGNETLVKLVEGKGTPFEKNGLIFTDIVGSDKENGEVEAIYSVFLTSPQKIAGISEIGGGYAARLVVTPNSVLQETDKKKQTSMGLWVAPPYRLINNILTKEYKDLLVSIEGFTGTKIKPQKGSSGLVVQSKLDDKVKDTGWVLKVAQAEPEPFKKMYKEGKK